jgi:hypothetical protein
VQDKVKAAEQAKAKAAQQNNANRRSARLEQGKKQKVCTPQESDQPPSSELLKELETRSRLLEKQQREQGAAERMGAQAHLDVQRQDYAETPQQ